MKEVRRSSAAHVTPTFKLIISFKQIFNNISKIEKNETQIISINKKYII